MSGAVARAEAARDFLFDLWHAHGAFGLVVRKWHGKIADEAQNRVGMFAEATQQVGGDGLLGSSGLDWRHFRIEMFAFTHPGPSTGKL